MGVSHLARSRFVLIFVALILLVALVAPAAALATEIRSADQVVIGPDEVIEDDLYVFATTVIVEGTVKGDLVALATQTTINGTVEGDVLALGQALVINGTVADDVRTGGQVILLNPAARVADDLIVGGFSLESKPGSSVGGDLYFGGYQTLLAGSVERNVGTSGLAVALSGPVGGDVTVELGDAGAGPQPTFFMPQPPVPYPSVPAGLTVADSASIGGKLDYTAPAEARIGPSAQVSGEVAYEPVVPVEPAVPTAASIALDHLRRLVTFLLVGLLMLWVAPTWTAGLGETIRERPLASLGWGAVALLVFPIVVIAVASVAILLAIFFGGLTLGGLVGPILGVGLLTEIALVVTFLTATYLVTPVVVSLLGGSWLFERLQPGQAIHRVLAFVVGVIVLVILMAIPWVGLLAGLLVSMAGLGALVLWGTGLVRRAPAGTAAGQRPAELTYVGAT